MANSFKCKECKVLIQSNEFGNITECEHHPFTELEPVSYRHSFQCVLAEYARAENPVTKWSLREILIHRLEGNDIS